jgi:two-component system, cell cycle sensor histidine kinase and response regulator CckA
VLRSGSTELKFGPPVPPRAALSEQEPNLPGEIDAGASPRASARHNSASRLRDVLRSVGAIVWEWDIPGQRLTFISDGVELLLGYPAEHFLRHPDAWKRAVLAEDHGVIARLAEERPASTTIEYRARSASGELFWLRDHVRRVHHKGADLLRGVVVDISEAKRAEDALRNDRDFYLSLFDDFPTMVWRSRPDGAVDYFNRAWLEFGGRRIEDELGDGWVERIHEDDRDPVLRRWYDAITGRTRFRAEYRLRHRSGTYLGYVGSVVDLSEQRALEQQLRQAQKMEAIGQLAGGIAHDFNNILMAIGGHADHALQQCAPDGSLAAEIEEIRRSAERAASLTRQLLAFSRQQVLQPAVFELGSVVAELYGMLRRLIPESIDLECMAPLHDARIYADPAQIQQVLVNLVLNARDAMPEGGTLSVKVETFVVEGDSHPAHEFIPPGDYVRLSVTDNGTGMTPSVLNHIFEPFFTTKEPGRGTGLGLATAYGIVKQSGGFIVAESEPGRGSTFAVLMPRVQTPAYQSIQLPAHATARASGGDETLLVVEDEPAVRRLVARALRAQGYTVLEAADADEAEAILDRAGVDPDLLITDVVLPGTSGVALARRLTSRMPNLGVLLTSGFPRDHFESGIPSEWAFMEKPFAPQELQARVRSMLDAGTARP